MSELPSIDDFIEELPSVDEFITEEKVVEELPSVEEYVVDIEEQIGCIPNNVLVEEGDDFGFSGTLVGD